MLLSTPECDTTVASNATEASSVASGTVSMDIDCDTIPRCKKRGRPMKAFGSTTVKTRHRRVAELVSKYSLEELEFAVETLKQRSHSVLQSPISNSKCLQLTKALALYMDLDLTERKYIVLRKAINELHPNCFPSLYALQTEKKKLIPSIVVSENSAEVELKTLMRRTAESIIQLCKVEDKIMKISLICKWGMDGSSGHSQYKQKFENETLSDEFMFFIAFVPLR